MPIVFGVSLFQSFDRHAVFQFNIIQSYFCPAKHFVLARQLEMGLSGGES